MRYNKRTLRRTSAAMIVFALVLRLVIQTGIDARAGQAIRQALSSPETAAFLFYLELGQVGAWSEDKPGDGQAGQDGQAAGSPLPAEETQEAAGTGEAEAQDGPAAEDQPADQAGQAGQADQEPPAQDGQTPAADPGGSEASQSSGGETGSNGEAGSSGEAASGGETGAAGETAPAKPAADSQEPLVFTPAEAAAIAIGGGCTYQVDKEGLLLQPSFLDFDQEGPTVLIVHTHTSEAYTQEAGWEYDENETARTQDPDFSVVRVGRELAETLEAHGISVIHDTSFNDYPSYNGAYDRTLTKIQQWVELYPSIQMVIDLHRDAAANADGTPVSHTAVINGESTAQLMLVMGTDQGGLWHPHWQDNLSWGLKLQAVLNRMYPGLCRDLNLRTERFNQHVTAGSMLIEVGSSGNTLRQALAAARDLGEGLAALIEGT